MAAIKMHKSDPRSPLKPPFLVEDVSAGMRQQDIYRRRRRFWACCTWDSLGRLGTAHLSLGQNCQQNTLSSPFLKTTDAQWSNMLRWEWFHVLKSLKIKPFLKTTDKPWHTLKPSCNSWGWFHLWQALKRRTGHSWIAHWPDSNVLSKRPSSWLHCTP